MYVHTRHWHRNTTHPGKGVESMLMLFKYVWIHWRVRVMVGQLLGNSISVEDTRTSLVRYTSPVLLERESTLLCLAGSFKLAP